MKVYIETFGCSANTSDSEIMAGLLEKSNYELVDDVKESDINIINTCIVKTPTEKRMVNRIITLTQMKKPLIIAGCMTKTERKIIEKINLRASMIGPDSIENIADVVRASAENKKVVFLEDLRKPKLCLPRIPKNPIIHITQISTGCNSSCSYCIVRLAKGKLFSYPSDMIVKDVRDTVAGGCKEIWLTSQDNAAYDFEGKRLPDLLREICEIEGKFFIRVGMMNPLHTKEILDDLIEAYKNEKIFKFLHLPVQSFSSRILRLMKRGYEPNTFFDIANRFNKSFPHLTLSTDLIVGFPSEYDSDHEATIRLLEEMKPDIVNISRFGPRPGTEAEKMEQVPQEIINKRSKELFELSRKISQEKNQKWIGWQGECLIDEKGTKKSSYVGRNFAYKPIILRSSKNLLGKFVEIEIVEAKSNFLIGTTT